MNKAIRVTSTKQAGMLVGGVASIGYAEAKDGRGGVCPVDPATGAESTRYAFGWRVEELIMLRGRFVDVLAAAPDGGRDVHRWIESAAEKLDVQTVSSRPAKMTKRYWAVGGTRLAKRSQVRLVDD